MGTVLGSWSLIACLHYSYQQLVRWLIEKPAERTQLNHKKSKIAEGYDADFCIWRPDAPFDIKVQDIHFKNKVSPYIGHTLYGAVDRTIVRGNVAFDRESAQQFASKPHGESILI